MPALDPLERIADALETPLAAFFAAPAANEAQEEAVDRIAARLTELAPAQIENMEALIAAGLRLARSQKQSPKASKALSGD